MILTKKNFNSPIGGHDEAKKKSIKPTGSLKEIESDGIVDYVTQIVNYLAELSIQVANFQENFFPHSFLNIENI